MIISENGNKRTVVPILKIVWARLISVCVIIPAPISTKNTLNITIAAMLKMIVPIILNNRCMIAAVFAFFFAPILDMIAVTQVPMFCPIMM